MSGKTTRLILIAAVVAVLAWFGWVLAYTGLNGSGEYGAATGIVDDPNAPDIAWHDDLATALGVAQKSGKLVFIEFGAPWCAFCNKLERETFPDARVRRAIDEGFVAVKINVEQDALAVKEYGVGPIPALIVTDSNGKVIERALGFRPPEQLVAFLNSAKQ